MAHGKGGRSIGPLLRNLCLTHRTLYRRGKGSGTCWEGSWVGSSIGLDVLEEGKNHLPLPAFEPASFSPEPSHYTNRAVQNFTHHSRNQLRPLAKRLQNAPNGTPRTRTRNCTEYVTRTGDCLALSLGSNNSGLNYTEKLTYGPNVSHGLDLNVRVSEAVCVSNHVPQRVLRATDTMIKQDRRQKERLEKWKRKWQTTVKRRIW
jgi:hypothetical protein